MLRAMALQAQRQSVAARIRTEVQLYGQHLAGSGTYVQGPAQPGAWRLELRMQTDDGSTSLVQVCDGAQLWTYRQAADRPLLERVDAGIVAAALARREKERSAGSAPPQMPVGLGLGYGGLPRLLRMLSEAFDYRAINEGRLEGMPVWILEGTWTPELLAVLLPEQKGAIEAGQGVQLAKLPTHIPDRVTLYLGRDDLFPYRLEYHRDHLGEKEWERAERANPPHSIVKLEWFEVRFDLPLARDQFAFDPGETKYEDATKRYLESLGLPTP
ncbi:MAG: hypothetical protein JNG90_12575 [Planctomycetaceae bacterium]|nr:hypothetical protein [Planctomycetaceae bacterium]